MDNLFGGHFLTEVLHANEKNVACYMIERLNMMQGGDFRRRVPTFFINLYHSAMGLFARLHVTAMHSQLDTANKVCDINLNKQY